MFVAVAEAKGFRAAGERLGVSGSAVSQAIRRLEDRLGIVLLQRTTRSVHLTEAGERLYAAAKPALDDLRGAIDAAGRFGDEPRGTLRLHVGTAVDTLLSGPVLAGFLAAHPQVQIELVVSDAPADIVAEGYDAGIQLGEVIDRDMIAVPVTGDISLVVVGAPSYFAKHAKPKHPRDLVDHECINWQPSAESPAYRWEFTEKGRDFAVAVRSRMLTNDTRLIVRLARAGTGLAMVYEDQVRESIASGHLEPVLKEFCTPFPGYYLYYPQRRQASTALRALFEYLKRARSGKKGRGAR